MRPHALSCWRGEIAGGESAAPDALLYLRRVVIPIDLRDTAKGLALAFFYFSGLFEYLVYQQDAERFNIAAGIGIRVLAFSLLCKGLFWGMPWAAVPTILQRLSRSPRALCSESIGIALLVSIAYVLVAMDGSRIGSGVFWILATAVLAKLLRLLVAFRRSNRVTTSRYELPSETGRQLYFRHVVQMRQLRRISFSHRDSGSLNSVWMHELPLLAVGFWIHPRLLLLWAYFFLTRLYDLILGSQAPFVLVLGQSDDAAHRLIGWLKFLVWPSTVVSLMVDRTGRVNLARHLSAWDSVRTRDPEQWRWAVDLLLDLSHLIVVTGTMESEPVRYELDLIRAKQLEHKCLFVVPTADAARALRQRLGTEFGLRDLYIVGRESDIGTHVRHVHRRLLAGRTRSSPPALASS
jgi:hypothetical protein